MATPRSNWFKVADSVAFESWSNDVAATFMRLGAYMNTRWARDGKRSEDRGRVVLSSAVLQQLTGTRSLARARRVLHELAVHITLVIDEQGADTACEWPKYAKFQEMGSRESPLPISEPSPSPSQYQTKKEEKRERAPSAPVAGAPPRAPRRELVEKPENFPEDSRERLRIWGESKGFGRDLLNAGLERFREWEPQKPPYRRTFKQWEGSFKKIVREGVAAGMIGKPESSKPGSRYRAADDVIAEAKKKQAEDDAKRAPETAEQIGQLIDMSLRKAIQ